MEFVAMVEDGGCEALVGFSQHGFGVPVLRVRAEPRVAEDVYYPPCTADPDLALVLSAGDALTDEGVARAVHTMAAATPEYGQPEDVALQRWVEADGSAAAAKGNGQAAGLVFLAPTGEIECAVAGSVGAEREEDAAAAWLEGVLDAVDRDEPVSLWLREIAEVPLLTADEEMTLSEAFSRAGEGDGCLRRGCESERAAGDVGTTGSVGVGTVRR